MKKKLFLFTDKYPYNLQHEQFIANEIALISDEFDEITAFPLNKSSDIRIVPPNVKVDDLAQRVVINKFSDYSKNLFLIIYVIFYEFINTSYKKDFLNNFRAYLRRLLNAVSYAEELVKVLKKEDLKSTQMIFYSYWFYDWCIVLGILKFKGVINNYFSRGHLGDIFQNLTPGRIIPFQNFKLKTITRFYSVSRAGCDYLIKQHPGFKKKITYSYLGVKALASNPVNQQKFLTIVSCSYLSARKRVHLIPEILSHLDLPIKWIHFGDGPEFLRIKKLIETLPGNINVELKGHHANEKILEFYMNNQVDFFINTSESEGIPVSLMEAASCGIPLIATDVFGNSEIVNEKNGILISIDFNPKELAQKIKEVVNSNKLDTLRLNSKEHYMKNFQEKDNYKSFITELKNSVFK